MSRSDGSTADYYVLPEGATQLQNLISHRDMNSQIGEIFRACYRYGIVSHSDKMRDAKKIRFYAQAEVERLEKLAQAEQPSHIISDICAWKGAPEWAEYLAMDKNGIWAWFQNEPYQHTSNTWFNNREHQGKWIRAHDITSLEDDWTKTLFRRPARTAQ
ncbi:hypothetical protein D3C86_1298340 [compost metagenome]